MQGYLVVFLAGALFAVGLGISGMTLPQKVIGFLDVAGEWDPSLAFVMAGSASVYMLFYRKIRQLSHPVFGTQFHVPSRSDIDQRLVTGAVLFGIGWGLVGLCPGPALTALVSGYGKALIFFVSMAAGMYAYRTLDLLAGMYTTKGAEVDG